MEIPGTISPEHLNRVFERFDQFSFHNLLSPAELHTNSGGTPLFGYDDRNFAKATMHFGSLANRGYYDRALGFMEQFRVTLELDSLALNFLNLVLPRALWDRFGLPIDDGKQRDPSAQLALRLYEGFTGRSIPEIEALLEDGQRWQILWNRLVPDEDHPTAEQLGAYHNSLVFPFGDLLTHLLKSRISVAYRFLPVLLAHQVKARRVYDYGGGSGLTTTAMARSGIPDVVLIEESQAMLDFARWRDQHCGISQVRYLRESEVLADPASYGGQFDVGVCTEVLEHMLDVQGTVRRLADLLRPGGYLFMSASFGLYPHLSHLKQNVRYAGREDQLMATAGLHPVDIRVPIPMITSVRMYQRK